MKYFLCIIQMMILMQACVSTRCVETTEAKIMVSIDPHVRNWISNNNEQSSEHISVIVATNSELTDITFLKKVSENYYTGEVTFPELKKLILDSRVKRISSGSQKLHN